MWVTVFPLANCRPIYEYLMDYLMESLMDSIQNLLRTNSNIL